MNKTNNRGFTLIEILLVVGALIAITSIGYYGINKNDTPEEVMERIVDPRSAAGNACTNECDRIYGETESTEGNACRSVCNDAMEKPKDEMMQKDESMMKEYSGTLLAGTAAPLLDFVKTDYDAALKTNKLVVLYFYANWCPICKKETVDALYPAFNALTRNDVIGFRVNFNDDETDANEKALAREFGVAYQHTKVFVKNGIRILKSPESWNKTRYADEIEKAI